ncbi:DNA-binding protein [Azotobacter chroococcum]|uniref:DNA-binding protein n=1 Tax=Azotobacter chroococcum TaxID=353 RepID=UPI0010ADC377|nr:DNA-binding protein [Azotobacter chroococcum]TKD34371.1 kfra protein [Azotobacter chroococcum]
MRPAEVTTEQIIEAGQALQAAGRNVTGFALRQRLGGGNVNRLKAVWEEHVASQAVTRAEPVAELPIEVAEQLKADSEGLVERLARLAVELNDRAVKAAERRVAELVRTTGEQREQMERELVDASTAIDEIETQLAAAQTLYKELNAKLADERERSQGLALELAQVRERTAATEKAAKEAAQAAAQREADLHEQLQQARQAEQAAREREATANGQLLAAMQQHKEDSKASAELRRDLEKARKEAEDGRIHLQAAQARLDGAVREIEEARKQVREARDEAKEASGRAAELRGELKAVQQELAALKAEKTQAQPSPQPTTGHR